MEVEFYVLVLNVLTGVTKDGFIGTDVMESCTQRYEKKLTITLLA